MGDRPGPREDTPHRRNVPQGVLRYCKVLSGMGSGTNGAQEKFAVLRHAAGCFKAPTNRAP